MYTYVSTFIQPFLQIYSYSKKININTNKIVTVDFSANSLKIRLKIKWTATMFKCKQYDT